MPTYKRSHGPLRRLPLAVLASASLLGLIVPAASATSAATLDAGALEFRVRTIEANIIGADSLSVDRLEALIEDLESLIDAVEALAHAAEHIDEVDTDEVDTDEVDEADEVDTDEADDADEVDADDADDADDDADDADDDADDADDADDDDS